MIWTVVVENTVTGVIQTPIVHGEWSGKLALKKARYQYDSVTDNTRVVCLVKGQHDQSVFPSIDNTVYQSHPTKADTSQTCEGEGSSFYEVGGGGL